MDNLHFIVNPGSRGGYASVQWRQVKEYLLVRGIKFDAKITEKAGDGRRFAREYSGLDEKCVRLIVIGGDGTANEVIDGIADFEKVWFGYIPSGSGNDLARGLSLSENIPVNLGRIVECTKPTLMDIGETTLCDEDGRKIKRRFAISSGVGIDADVCRQTMTSKLKKFLNKINLGSLTYVLLTVKTIFTMPVTSARVTFDGSPEQEINNVIFAVAMNHKCEGGGVMMAPNASAQDGRLSVLLVHDIPRFKALMVLPKLISGKHVGRPGFEIYDCSKFGIIIKDKMALHLDGEYGGYQQELSFSVLPGVLKVML